MKYAERPVLHRWSRDEYARLIDHGFLDEDAPIELLDGLLLIKEPQHSPHRTAVLLVAKAMERAFGEGWFVQTQSPIILGDRSEPEPDVCVVQGSPRDYVDAHPRRPALIIEVAQSGLRVARGRKATVYARARIADYWIVNLVEGVLEVHREPARPGPARAAGRPPPSGPPPGRRSPGCSPTPASQGGRGPASARNPRLRLGRC